MNPNENMANTLSAGVRQNKKHVRHIPFPAPTGKRCPLTVNGGEKNGGRRDAKQQDTGICFGALPWAKHHYPKAIQQQRSDDKRQVGEHNPDGDVMGSWYSGRVAAKGGRRCRCREGAQGSDEMCAMVDGRGQEREKGMELFIFIPQVGLGKTNEIDPVPTSQTVKDGGRGGRLQRGRSRRGLHVKG